MSNSRRLPKFDSVHFATLSHEQKLELLNHFLDALDRSQAARNHDSQELAERAPKQARSSS